MGMRAASLKIGAKQKTVTERQIDDPYAHLAVSILIQAFEDLKSLNGSDKKQVDQCVINKWEILNFFRSDWCGFLLSCQGAVTQERLKEKVMSIL